MARSTRDLANSLTGYLQGLQQFALRLLMRLYDPWRLSGEAQSDDTAWAKQWGEEKINLPGDNIQAIIFIIIGTEQMLLSYNSRPKQFNFAPLDVEVIKQQAS